MLKNLNLKWVFAIIVLVATIVLLIAKVITVQMVIDNWLAIGSGLVAIYAWLSKEETKKENKELKVNNASLETENKMLSKKAK